MQPQCIHRDKSGNGALAEPILIPVSMKLLFKEKEKRDSIRALDELTGAVQWDLLFPPRSATTCFDRLQSICLLLQFKFIEGLNGLRVAGKPQGYPPSPKLLHVKTAYGKTLFNQIVCVCDNLILVKQPDLWLESWKRFSTTFSAMRQFCFEEVDQMLQ